MNSCVFYLTFPGISTPVRGFKNSQFALRRPMPHPKLKLIDTTADGIWKKKTDEKYYQLYELYILLHWIDS